MAKIQLLSLAQTSISFFGGFSHGGFAEAFLGGLFGCLFQQLIYQALHHVLQFRKLEISMENLGVESKNLSKSKLSELESSTTLRNLIRF